MPLDVPTIGQGVTLLSGDCRDVLPTLAANTSWAPAEDPADARMAADARQRDMFDQC